LVQQGTQKETLTKFYENAKSVFLLKTKTNTYSVSKQRDKNRHGPSKQLGPKLQQIKSINKNRTYLVWV